MKLRLKHSFGAFTLDLDMQAGGGITGLTGGAFGGSNGGGIPEGPRLTRGTVGIGALALVALWAFSSFYTVRPEEQSVELFLGKYSATGNPGLNFAPWPLVTAEVINVTSERTENVGVASSGSDAGLMLTTDANVVDIDFQVVWNINDAGKYLFNIRDAQPTVQALLLCLTGLTARRSAHKPRHGSGAMRLKHSGNSSEPSVRSCVSERHIARADGL